MLKNYLTLTADEAAVTFLYPTTCGLLRFYIRFITCVMYLSLQSASYTYVRTRSSGFMLYNKIALSRKE